MLCFGGSLEFFTCLGLCSDLVGKSHFRYSAVSFRITLLPKYFALTLRMSGIRCLFTLSGFVEQIKSWKAVGLQASRVCTKYAGSLWSQLAFFLLPTTV